MLEQLLLTCAVAGGGRDALAARAFDECDATGQQRRSAVLFRRQPFRPGLAASGWASVAHIYPLGASSLRTGKGAPVSGGGGLRQSVSVTPTGRLMHYRQQQQ